MALEELLQEHPRLPRFTGSNPNLWISQAEQYFLFYTIDDDERFPYVIESFDDEPFWWFNGWYRGSHSLTWNDFTTAMITQFQATSVDPIATEPCSIHQTKVAVDPSQELALFDSTSTANSIVAMSFTSGLVHSDSVTFATTDLKVFDEMLISIENEIVKEVHETMDDEVLEIQENDMVETNDCDVESSAVSVVFQSFAWKPGLFENPVTVSTYPTSLDSPPSFIPPLDEELNHNPLFDFDLGPIHSVLIQQNRHATDPILALVAPLTPNSSMPSVDVSGAIREGYLDILLSQKLVQVYPVPTFVILSVGTLNLQFDCSAMVIDCLISPFFAKVPRTYFGFDPGSCVFKMPYSDRIIILLNHIGVALVESTASNMDHQCHFGSKLFILDDDPEPPDPYTTITSDSVSVYPKRTCIVLVVSTTRCIFFSSTLMVADPCLFSEAKLHGFILGVVNSPLSVEQLPFYRKVALLEPVWKFWKTYNAVVGSFLQGDKLMVSLESLLYAASVDIVFVGHMNAYERSTRMYNGKFEPCGPILLIIGNRGNKDGITTTYKAKCGVTQQPRKASMTSIGPNIILASLIGENSTNMQFDVAGPVTNEPFAVFLIVASQLLALGHTLTLTMDPDVHTGISSHNGKTLQRVSASARSAATEEHGLALMFATSTSYYIDPGGGPLPDFSLNHMISMASFAAFVIFSGPVILNSVVGIHLQMLNFTSMHLFTVWLEFLNLGYVKQEAFRRDLTRHSVFYHVTTCSIVDFATNRFVDLNFGQFVTILSIKETTSDFLLRALQAIRFSPMFDFARDHIIFKHIQELLRGEIKMQYRSLRWSVGATLGYAKAPDTNSVIACIIDDGFQVTTQDISTMTCVVCLSVLNYLCSHPHLIVPLHVHDIPDGSTHLLSIMAKPTVVAIHILSLSYLHCWAAATFLSSNGKFPLPQRALVVPHSSCYNMEFTHLAPNITPFSSLYGHKPLAQLKSSPSLVLNDGWNISFADERNRHEPSATKLVALLPLVLALTSFEVLCGHTPPNIACYTHTAIPIFISCSLVTQRCYTPCQRNYFIGTTLPIC